MCVVQETGGYKCRCLPQFFGLNCEGAFHCDIIVWKRIGQTLSHDRRVDPIATKLYAVKNNVVFPKVHILLHLKPRIRAFQIPVPTWELARDTVQNTSANVQMDLRGIDVKVK